MARVTLMNEMGAAAMHTSTQLLGAGRRVNRQRVARRVPSKHYAAKDNSKDKTQQAGYMVVVKGCEWLWRLSRDERFATTHDVRG